MITNERNYDSSKNILLCIAHAKKAFSGVETGSFWLHLYLNIVVAGRELTSFP